MIIRYLEIKDIEKARAILDACYPPDTRDGNGEIFEKDLRASLHGGFYEWSFPKFIGAEVNDKIVGVAGFGWSNISERVFELCWGTVHPDYQGQGIGHKMLDFRISEIKKAVDLSPSIVLVHSLPSSLFLKNGFQKLRPLGLNKYLMAKEIA